MSEFWLSKEEADLVDGIEWSLLNEPQKWSRDQFAAEHLNGMRVWTANRGYGMDISHNGLQLMGGVTFLSALFGWFIPWRVRLKRAADTLGQMSQEDFVKALSSLK